MLETLWHVAQRHVLAIAEVLKQNLRVAYYQRLSLRQIVKSSLCQLLCLLSWLGHLLWIAFEDDQRICDVQLLFGLSLG